MTLPRPLVDVVLPAKDAEAVIARAICSVRQQTLASWRLVCVDDGSADSTRATIHRFAANDGRIAMVEGRRQGPGAARNLGAAAGDAEFLTFIDADDVWQPDHLESLMDLSCAGRNKVAVARWEGRPDPIPRELLGRMWEPKLSAVFRGQRFKAVVDSIHSSGLLLTRRAFLDSGQYYEGVNYGEDSWLFARLLYRERVAFASTATYRFTEDHSGLSVGRASPYPLPPLVLDGSREQVPVELEDHYEHFRSSLRDFCYRRAIIERNLGLIATDLANRPVPAAKAVVRLLASLLDPRTSKSEDEFRSQSSGADR